MKNKAKERCKTIKYGEIRVKLKSGEKGGKACSYYNNHAGNRAISNV